jgi:hypothetical protein
MMNFTEKLKFDFYINNLLSDFTYFVVELCVSEIPLTQITKDKYQQIFFIIYRSHIVT